MFGDSVARKIKEYNGTKIILISAYDLDDVACERFGREQIHSKIHRKTDFHK